MFDIRSCHPFACRYSKRGITPSVCTVSKLTLSQNHDASANRPEATKVKYFIFATLYRRPRGPASPRVGRSTTAASVGVGWTHRSPIPHPRMPTNAAFHRCACTYDLRIVGAEVVSAIRIRNTQYCPCASITHTVVCVIPKYSKYPVSAIRPKCKYPMYPKYPCTSRVYMRVRTSSML